MGLEIRKMTPRNEQIYWQVIRRLAEEIWQRRKQEQLVKVPGVFEFNTREQDSKTAAG